MKLFVIVLLLLSVSRAVFSQYLEQWIEDSENPDELKVWFEDLRNNKLDLSQATIEKLSSLPFFDEITAKQLLAHKQAAEEFREVLQCDFLNEAQKESLRNFCILSADKFSQTKFNFRLGANTQKQIGSEDFNNGSNLSGTARADFIRVDKISGYLFADRVRDSEHLFNTYFAGIDIPQQNFRPRLLLGDYQAEFGTGLVFSRGYGQANWVSSDEQMIPSPASGFYGKPTLSGLAMYRGAAVEFHQNIFHLNFLVSSRQLDGQISEEGVLKLTENQTSSEDLTKARDQQVRENLFGVAINGKKQYSEIGITAYRSRFSPKFVAEDTENYLFGLAGDKVDVGSVYLRGKFKRMYLNSEFAFSNPGGYANQSSISYINNSFGWTLYHIESEPNFYSIHSKLWDDFSTESNNKSKTGLKISVGSRSQKFTLSGNKESSIFGISTSILRKKSGKIQVIWKSEIMPSIQLNTTVNRSFNEETSITQPSANYYTDKARSEVIFHGNEEYKLRFEIKSSKSETANHHSIGTLLFFQSKFKIKSLDCFLRLSQFNIENQKVNLFMYENTVWGDFPLTQLSGTGGRVAFMLSKKFENFRLSAKIADTAYELNASHHHNTEFLLEMSYHQ